MTTSLFLHAHPDDEAIFTGGTIALLKEQGHKVVVVFATGGELGKETDEELELEHIRQKEARDSAAILGADSCIFMSFKDSGLDINNIEPDSFAACDIEAAAKKLCEIIKQNDVQALFCDDIYGVYGHPDHLMAHKVGLRAATMSGIEEIYFHTADREYLHFVETHLVEEANASRPHEDIDNKSFGMSSIEITHTIDATTVIASKRAAMVAHKSQIDDTSSAFTMDDEDFLNVYGYEWYVRDSRGDHSNSILSQLPSK